MQLEELVKEVMALPDDLKTKLSLDEDLVSSPKEALSRASTERVVWRGKNFRSGFSHSCTNHREKKKFCPRLILIVGGLITETLIQ